VTVTAPSPVSLQVEPVPEGKQAQVSVVQDVDRLVRSPALSSRPMQGERSKSQRPETIRVVHRDAVLTAVERRNALAIAWYDAPQPGHLLTVLRLMQETQQRSGARTCA